MGEKIINTLITRWSVKPTFTATLLTWYIIENPQNLAPIPALIFRTINTTNIAHNKIGD